MDHHVESTIINSKLEPKIGGANGIKMCSLNRLLYIIFKFIIIFIYMHMYIG